MGYHTYRRLRWLLLLVCLGAMVAPLSGVAAQAHKAVLLLFPYQSNLPRSELVLQALAAEFDNAPDLAIEWYYEYLDLNRFTGEAYEQQLAALYAAKYRQTPLDLVFVIGEGPLNFWLQHRDAIAPTAPVVFFGIENPQYLSAEYQPPPHVTGLVSLSDETQLLKWAAALRPRVTEMVLVQGVSTADHNVNAALADLQDDLDGQLQLTDWSMLPLAEIKQRAATLPPGTAIFYQYMFEDAAGGRYRPMDALSELLSVSAAPVIVRQDYFIGTGALGGYVFSAEAMTAGAARLGERILRGAAVADIPIAGYQSNRFMFDHLALQRFNIPLATLPAGSIIKNRQYTLWEQYGAQLLGLAALVGVAFAGSLLRIRSVKARNRELDEMVQTKTAQMLAQQRKMAVLEERERIGRDLHDSLGQALGFLNVQTQAAQALLADGKLEASRQLLTRLVEVTQQAHIDTRQFMLTMQRPQASVGLAPPDFWATLRAYLQDFEEQSGVAVQFSMPELEGPFLPPEKTLNLLRIIQEALINVRKHAGAGKVQLIFSQVGDALQVVIADDGRGFAAQERVSESASERVSEAGNQTPETSQPETAVPHLGLGIMRERATEIGGQLEIRSQPGRGTQVLVQVPLADSPPAQTAPPGMSALRVLLADDHPLVLEGLRNLLSAYGLDIVGLAYDGLEALALARRLRPDVIVMDIQMPRCDGIEATRRIKAELPEMKIMILTTSADEALLFEALKAGASGYLLKSMQAEEFFALIAGLDDGAPPIAPQLAGKVLAALQARLATEKVQEATGLSTEQQKVLDLVAQGLTYGEVSQRLFVSERTVRRRMKEILAQLQVSSRAEALQYAAEP